MFQQCRLGLGIDSKQYARVTYYSIKDKRDLLHSGIYVEGIVPGLFPITLTFPGYQEHLSALQFD
jgi:hypothetical protein